MDGEREEWQMKRALVFLLAGSMTLGVSACGTKQEDTPQTSQETEAAEGTEAAFTWKNETKENPELKGLTEDIMVSVLKESYPDYRRWDGYTFTVKGMQTTEDSVEMDFDFDAAYRELTPDENPAMPLIVGEEELHFTLPLRLTATVRNGKIDTEDLSLVVREDTSAGQEKWHLLTQDLPEISEAGTFTGTIQFNEDGELQLNRKIWIEETHGITDNGYFLLETNTSYTLPVSESCEVSYYADASTVDSMTLEKLKQMENLQEHLFMVTYEEDAVRYIIEVYRP